ncbi:MAG: hypothetical protein M3Z26_11790 [Bacteroidota bacterium]|nr:hypothetical protein [Bacteroidota bacterium]
MPLLAESFTVVVADIRGMGNSDKPENGYDKKPWLQILQHSRNNWALRR